VCVRVGLPAVALQMEDRLYSTLGFTDFLTWCLPMRERGRVDSRVQLPRPRWISPCGCFLLPLFCFFICLLFKNISRVTNKMNHELKVFLGVQAFLTKWFWTRYRTISCTGWQLIFHFLVLFSVRRWNLGFTCNLSAALAGSISSVVFFIHSRWLLNSLWMEISRFSPSVPETLHLDFFYGFPHDKIWSTKKKSPFSVTWC
jgi:hypothetical protein